MNKVAERNVFPSAASQLSQGNANGYCRSPGGELAATVELVELVENPQQRVLRAVL